MSNTPLANHPPSGNSAPGPAARKPLPKFKKKTPADKEQERREKEEEERRRREKEEEEKRREEERREEERKGRKGRKEEQKWVRKPGEVRAPTTSTPARPPQTLPRPTIPLPRRPNQPAQPPMPRPAQPRSRQGQPRNSQPDTFKASKTRKPKKIDVAKKGLHSFSPKVNAAPTPVSTPAAKETPKVPVKRQAPPGHTAAAKWKNGVLFAYNTAELPPDPDTAPPSGSVYADALLGPYECMRQPQLFNACATYMAFIRQPPPDFAEDLEYRRRDVLTDTDSYVVEYMRDRLHTLKADFAATSRLLQNIFFSDVLLADDFSWHTLKGTIIPATSAGNMWKASYLLSSGYLQHDLDSDLAWREFQRSSSIVEAFLYVCALLLRDVDHPVAARLRERREEAGDFPKRGVILTGDDIEKFHSFLLGNDVPTYVLIPFEELESAVDLQYSPTGDWRCSLDVDAKLSNIKQKDLPRSFYPAAGLAWELAEMMMISGIARPGARADEEDGDRDMDEDTGEDEEDEFKPSDRAQALKRRRIAGEQARKRQRTEEEEDRERREEEFKKKHPEMSKLTSAERYRWFAQAVPAMRSYYDRVIKPRPPNLPMRIVAFTHAESMMLDHGVMLDSGTKSQASYIPPLHIIIGANDARLIRYLVNFVHLLPSFLAVITLKRHRPDSDLGRQGPRTWRSMLNDIWQEDHLWYDAAPDELGGRDLFKSAFDHLRANPSARPAWGKLPCGCDPTVELLENDALLRAGLIFDINVWNLLHKLPELVPRKTLAASGIAMLKDEWGMHFTPDYTAPDPNYENEALNAIKRVVLGTHLTRANNWPRPWSAETDNEDERQAWLRHMATFMSGVRGAEWLDRKKSGSSDWPYTTEQLRKIGREGVPDEEMDVLEHHLYLRYVLASLARGFMPVEFQQRPDGDITRCQACRIKHAREHREAMQKPGEVSSEGTV
ncbi:unnamed protein product [Peniophora sp. CBMAI 1063]|nr:unnamed protein product [Peniophora sp. CBMAI 1063]